MAMEGMSAHSLFLFSLEVKLTTSNEKNDSFCRTSFWHDAMDPTDTREFHLTGALRLQRPADAWVPGYTSAGYMDGRGRPSGIDAWHR